MENKFVVKCGVYTVNFCFFEALDALDTMHIRHIRPRALDPVVEGSIERSSQHTKLRHRTKGTLFSIPQGNHCDCKDNCP